MQSALWMGAARMAFPRGMFLANRNTAGVVGGSREGPDRGRGQSEVQGSHEWTSHHLAGFGGQQLHTVLGIYRCTVLALAGIAVIAGSDGKTTGLTLLNQEPSEPSSCPITFPELFSFQ